MMTARNEHTSRRKTSTHDRLEEDLPVIGVPVLLPIPLHGPYDYRILGECPPKTGTFVQVPLGPRKMRGVVWQRKPEHLPSTSDTTKLKPLLHIFDCPPLATDVMDFVDWVATYALCPPGLVLRLVMRMGAALDTPKPRHLFSLAADFADQRITPQRQAIIAMMQQMPNAAQPLTIAQIAQRADVSESVTRGFVKAGGLCRQEIDPDVPFDPPDLSLQGASLSPDQDAAVLVLRQKIAARQFNCTLLDGVTGSGKTEVYLEAVAAALADDASAQILILLPEISLTLPFIERITARFGSVPAHWHSDMTKTARRRVWRRVLDGQARLVVGARSALFLPFKNLRLIIVDEEHEAVYKQQEGVLYHARDMAVLRGSRGGFPVILASATPALETVVNVQHGRYDTVKLPSRFGGAAPPRIAIVDMCQEEVEKGQWLAPTVIEGVTASLSRREQTLLFLNRRGYAPLTLCRKCGVRLTAPDSDTWLVMHHATNRLSCHHTGFSMPIPKACPHCNAEDSLTPCGPGVERVAEEAAMRWPDARIVVFSSDTVQSPKVAQELLEAMRQGEIDILVATQIVAKGHHFPNLTFVGVVDADLGVTGGDLRAAERMYQLLCQVAGRAGRALKPGRVLLQSYQPDHPVIKGLVQNNRDSFMAAEAEGREMLGFPPYGRLAAIILAASDEAALVASARALAAKVPHIEGVDIWGPAPAPLYRLRGTYRQRFLVRAGRHIAVQQVIKTWLSQIRFPTTIRCVVDIDPYSFT